MIVPLEGAAGVILDIGGIIAGLAAVIAAIAGIISARSAGRAATQTNGPLTAQAQTLALVHDAIRSVGHQVGELRDDLGHLAERHDADIRELRAKVSESP